MRNHILNFLSTSHSGNNAEMLFSWKLELVPQASIAPALSALHFLKEESGVASCLFLVVLPNFLSLKAVWARALVWGKGILRPGLILGRYSVAQQLTSDQLLAPSVLWKFAPNLEGRNSCKLPQTHRDSTRATNLIPHAFSHAFFIT